MGGRGESPVSLRGLCSSYAAGDVSRTSRRLGPVCRSGSLFQNIASTQATIPGAHPQTLRLRCSLALIYFRGGRVGCFASRALLQLRCRRRLTDQSPVRPRVYVWVTFSKIFKHTGDNPSCTDTHLACEKMAQRCTRRRSLVHRHTSGLREDGAEVHTVTIPRAPTHIWPARRWRRGAHSNDPLCQEPLGAMLDDVRKKMSCHFDAECDRSCFFSRLATSKHSAQHSKVFPSLQTLNKKC